MIVKKKLGFAIMSSYKGHTAFAVILSCLMFYNPLAIALAILGANFPDFDHEFTQNQVLTIFALGIIITMFLYFLNLPFYFGLILISLSLISAASSISFPSSFKASKLITELKRFMVSWKLGFISIAIWP